MTKLSPNLPKGDANGLGALDGPLIRNPATIRVVIALVDCKQVVHDNDTGDDIPTARIRRVAAVIPEDYPQAEQLVRRAIESYTGQAVLPFDLEQELRSLGHDIDPDTGAILAGNDDGEDVSNHAGNDDASDDGNDDDLGDEPEL